MWSPVPRKKTPALNGEAQEAPIARIAAAIIHQAIREKADSIRLLPNEAAMRVEYLLRDVWTETMSLPKHIESALVAHLKEMACLPTPYRMAMQGLILIRHAAGLSPGAQAVDLDYDVHLFITPTRQGEKIVMQIEAADGAHG